MIPAQEALERLRAGNRRFVSALHNDAALTTRTDAGKLAAEQTPFAIILGCSDARAPAEILFDQGLGDLFVIRVAGNIVAPSQIGSVEFAAENFGVRLAAVVGHTRCGAVLATLEALREPTTERSLNLRSIVDRIRPAIKGLLERDPARDPATLARDAVRANIRASVDRLRHGSQLLERLIGEGGLRIVGAEYSLETGVVDFFDDERAVG